MSSKDPLIAFMHEVAHSSKRALLAGSTLERACKFILLACAVFFLGQIIVASMGTDPALDALLTGRD